MESPPQVNDSGALESSVVNNQKESVNLKVNGD